MVVPVPLPAVLDDLLLSTLRSRFGLSDFRSRQREIIEAVINGEDSLVVLPTGGGKSLCFQLPGLMRGGLTIVVSPLIALMKDQVDSLLRIGVRATFLNSMLSEAEYHERLDSLLADASGESEGSSGKGYEICYVAPERFDAPSFMIALIKLNVTLLAVDEAHCISQWGHDFRPSYRRLRQVRELLKAPIVALTATATPEVQRDICENLGLAANVRTFVGGFDRPNLALEVRHMTVYPSSGSSGKDELNDLKLEAATGRGLRSCTAPREPRWIGLL